MIPRPFIAAAFILTAKPAAAASLLLNPDFEANPLAPGTSVPITRADFEAGETSPQTPGWAFSGVAGYLATPGVSSDYWGSSSRFTSQFAVLANFGDGGTYSSLIQTFTVPSAGSYRFSFDWQSGSFSETSGYENSVAGFGQLSLRIFTPGGEDAGYTQILTQSDQQGSLSSDDLTLPAGPAAIEILFNYQPGGGGYNHVFIDNVQATAIPEPTTLALFCAALGWTACRRKRC